MLGNPRNGLVPRNRVEAARRVAGERLPYAVGAVRSLQRGLRPTAQPPVIDGMVRVPLYLDRPALAHADVHAAAGRTFPACRRIVRRDAGNLIFVGNQIRDQFFDLVGRTAAECRRPAPGDTEHLEELPSIHPCGHDPPDLSNGRQCSPWSPGAPARPCTCSVRGTRHTTPS